MTGATRPRFCHPPALYEPRRTGPPNCFLPGKSMSPVKSKRCVIALLAAAVLSGSAAAAENLDQGKPAPKLFAESCAACHRSARGLAKGRFSLTLYLFLQKHYASNSSSAWTLTSYLESVDSAKRGEKRAAASPPQSSTWTPRASLRPPMPVPAR
jgi:mono/diheme cytochrome c family protein